MLDKRVKHPGVVLIDCRHIWVDGFEIEGKEGAMCREHAALGILWAIGELQRELRDIIAAPGLGRSIVGLPDSLMVNCRGLEVDGG